MSFIGVAVKRHFSFDINFSMFRIYGNWTKFILIYVIIICLLAQHSEQWKYFISEWPQHISSHGNFWSLNILSLIGKILWHKMSSRKIVFFFSLRGRFWWWRLLGFASEERRKLCNKNLLDPLDGKNSLKTFIHLHQMTIIINYDSKLFYVFSILFQSFARLDEEKLKRENLKWYRNKNSSQIV